MSNDKKQPWGNVVAVVRGSSEDDANYVNIGVAWYNEKDGRKSFSITFDVEPIAWKDPNCKRTILIQQRQPRNGR